LMASVAEGVFSGKLPWTMVSIGMVLAAGIIAFDLYLERRQARFRAPVLAVAVGIYLPFELSTPIFLGGLVAWLVKRTLARHGEQKTKQVEQRGLLLSSGLITGEALVGIGLAIPIVLSGKADVLAFLGIHKAAWPGALLLAVLLFFLYRLSVPRKTT